jgi:hypothetical protein
MHSSNYRSIINYFFPGVLAITLMFGTVAAQTKKAPAKKALTNSAAPTAPATKTTKKPETTGKTISATESVNGKNPVIEKILGNQPDTYTAVVVSEQSGQLSGKQTIFRKGNLQRIESNHRGIPIVYLVRPDKEKVFMVRADKKMYAENGSVAAFGLRTDPFNLEATRTLAPRNVKVEDLGKEDYNGHLCQKYRISYDEAANVKSVVVWKATDLKDLIIRQEMSFMSIQASSELQNVDLNVDAAIFEVPTDFQKVNNRTDMFRPQNGQNNQSVQSTQQVQPAQVDLSSQPVQSTQQAQPAQTNNQSEPHN